MKKDLENEKTIKEIEELISLIPADNEITVGITGIKKN